MAFGASGWWGGLLSPQQPLCMGARSQSLLADLELCEKALQLLESGDG